MGKLEKPKEGAYLDTRDRLLDRAHLIVRLRKGLFTIKARSTNLDELVDLKNCFKPKYEQDYFEDIGYSISVEIRHEKEEWIPDPTKATMAQSMEFLKKKCPPLFEQLEVILKPVSDLTAPGVARMWSAEFKPTHPLAGGLKESGISAWTFPGTDQTLVEVAWTGYMKDRAELDQLYFQVKERLDKAGLLAVDQSSKTERYFHAYYGATALDTRYGFLAPPAYVKYFEADPKDQVIPSPYQQIASREFPGYLETDLAPYDWVIDADGHVAFVPETMAPYGRVYEKGFVRPEDKSKKKPGTEEHYGHVAALGGMPGRISGEILFDKKLNAWVVNNKSGRYPAGDRPGRRAVGPRPVHLRVRPGLRRCRSRKDPGSRVRGRRQEEPPLHRGDGLQGSARREEAEGRGGQEGRGQARRGRSRQARSRRREEAEGRGREEAQGREALNRCQRTRIGVTP